VRGARALDGSGALLDGSCLVVDHILRLTGSTSIASLVGTFDISIDHPLDGASSPLYIALGSAAGERSRVFESGRVGLTLKKGPTEDRQRFLAKPYRFLTAPREVKKGKHYIVLSLYRQGVDEEEIAALTGVSRANVAKYASAYNAGKKQSPEAFAGELSSDELCALLGACDGKFS